jgi:hypothetical protein
MAKPSLFIGSSTEGLEFARALRSLLAHVAYPIFCTSEIVSVARQVL